MAYIYQAPDGRGLNRAAWEKHKEDSDWTVKEFRNDTIWVRLHWIGRYDRDLPAEYRHSHGITVYNRVKIRGSEWNEEGSVIDKGWIIDPTATQTARTKSSATSLYEDMLLSYGGAGMEEDEDGDMVLVENGNQLKPVVPGSTLIMDDEQVAAAAEKGVDLGGWS